ncbi:MAG: orotidine-5'-phosphate decarboxylase [Alphaproteobacteria bacterium]|nr:orotidine-5'-phosphate decarboxylase [Alphaproteobacteria bacterium]
MTRPNPICVALDTPDLSRAVALSKQLLGHVGMLKIGMEFFYAHGAAGYEAVAIIGIPIFLDLKLHDIPNTVAQGITSLLKLAPAPIITNVHATGGLDMMKAARDVVKGNTKLIAVTILTSLSNEDLWAAGFAGDKKTDEQALALAKLTHEAGLDGVVCSPLDLAKIRGALPRKFLTVVPGIRPATVAAHDQKRVATPKSAIAAGADILVIGRAITGADEPAQAAQDILQSLV